jgi:hypothetical protein
MDYDRRTDPDDKKRRGSDSNRRIEVLQTSPLATWVPRHFHLVNRINKRRYGADDGI